MNDALKRYQSIGNPRTGDQAMPAVRNEAGGMSQKEKVRSVEKGERMSCGILFCENDANFRFRCSFLDRFNFEQS